MLNGLYSTASALNFNFQRQDAIAHNLAHVNVPGFKKVFASVGTEPTHSPSSQFSMIDPNGNIKRGAINGARLLAINHDFSSGRLEETGLPLNVAINGPGFFEIEMDGRTLFTRNGNFKLNNQGELILSSGQKVMGESGPLRFPANTIQGNINIAQDGTVSLGDQILGTLKLVEFESPEMLRQVGTTMFQAPSNANTIESNSRIQQYTLESSNAQAVTELIQMINGMRHFEAAQKAMQSIAEAIQRHTTQGNS